MILTHKIELKPNNKQITYFKKACGVSRLAWNWGLTKWEEYYKECKKVHIPNLGWIRIREEIRFFIGKLFNATISKIADRWFIST